MTDEGSLQDEALLLTLPGTFLEARGDGADPSSGPSSHLLPQEEMGGADFSFASSDFNTLGAFFCNLSLSRLVSGVARSDAQARVLDVVG
jgi:hypothetical protein